MATVRRWTGREARALRQALRLSVRVFAEHLGVAARTISKWEALGEHTCPRPDTQAILDTALGQADAAVQERFGQLIDAAGFGHQPTRLNAAFRLPAKQGVLESPAEVVARRSELQASGLTSELVAEIEQFLTDLPDRYETAGPLLLAPEVVQARQLVQQLLAGNQRLKQRARLFELAGHLSGKLSYMAVNLGNFGAAQAYGAEAFELARFAEDDELTAWVQGTQCLAAYYAGDYKYALALAGDGQRYAKGGIQAVRLAINGEVSIPVES